MELEKLKHALTTYTTVAPFSPLFQFHHSPQCLNCTTLTYCFSWTFRHCFDCTTLSPCFNYILTASLSHTISTNSEYFQLHHFTLLSQLKPCLSLFQFNCYPHFFLQFQLHHSSLLFNLL